MLGKGSANNGPKYKANRRKPNKNTEECCQDASTLSKIHEKGIEEYTWLLFHRCGGGNDRDRTIHNACATTSSNRPSNDEHGGGCRCSADDRTQSEDNQGSNEDELEPKCEKDLSVRLRLRTFEL